MPLRTKYWTGTVFQLRVKCQIQSNIVWLRKHKKLIGNHRHILLTVLYPVGLSRKLKEMGSISYRHLSSPSWNESSLPGRLHSVQIAILWNIGGFGLFSSNITKIRLPKPPSCWKKSFPLHEKAISFQNNLAQTSWSWQISSSFINLTATLKNQSGTPPPPPV